MRKNKIVSTVTDGVCWGKGNGCPMPVGEWFSDSGRNAAAARRHEAASETVMNKFSIFNASYSQMSFIYRRMVFDAAPLPCSAELWLTNKIKYWRNNTIS